ncbi:hypothetical protein Gobs01_01598 [Geodermatophilus obscurus DSM 43160]|uniref:Uncharacterized protein n=1 Tax=Geodermatophilus obscurus (strain ATCC 25078 / DSM 43160 / JCM 3152 / CCUG 61914 / KCC A-0152 / KCTC 9177 / NBRC 13315 / NRRL B-3577 / G-20) TaxID=526225 RepID=D2S5Y7_GEOOG|nr:hypothetical protein Gobs_0419 [Geodermatophilus obscurus DSM 43160]
MGWVWTAVAVWVLLSVPTAVLLGRAIHRAERPELAQLTGSPTPVARSREPDRPPPLPH